MSRIFILCTLFLYVNSQRFVPAQNPCPCSMKKIPLTPCGNPQPVRNTVIGCLDPFVNPCGTITEVPMNLGNVFLPAPLPNQIVPGCASQANYMLPAAPNMLPASLPLANPFLPIASPVSAYMSPISPLLPAASPCNNRCQYLKKIPIPPPCI